MDGPSHYRVAEELLESCRLNPGLDEITSDGTPIEIYSPALEVTGGEGDAPEDTCRNALMAAQVHATLAQVAATVSAAAHPGQSQVDYLSEWWRVIGT